MKDVILTLFLKENLNKSGSFIPDNKTAYLITLLLNIKDKNIIVGEYEPKMKIILGLLFININKIILI